MDATERTALTAALTLWRVKLDCRFGFSVSEHRSLYLRHKDVINAPTQR